MVELSEHLYAEFMKSRDTIDRYDFPFPMAVFGTLRSFPENQGNSNKMYAYGEVEPLEHRKAFIPHLEPRGIWLEYRQNNSGPFELYSYSPDDWKQMIIGVDRLEGFNKYSGRHGYLRTLMGARLLPEDYRDKVFGRGIGGPLGLNIQLEEFDSYPVVPCWVYSNRGANSLVKKNDNVILWDGPSGK